MSVAKRNSSKIHALAGELVSTDDCAGCVHSHRLPGSRRAIYGLPWACLRTGGPALMRCDFYSEEEDDAPYLNDDRGPDFHESSVGKDFIHKEYLDSLRREDF